MPQACRCARDPQPSPVVRLTTQGSGRQREPRSTMSPRSSTSTLPDVRRHRRHRCPSHDGGGLRKDYAYLFESFFGFLEDSAAGEHGVLVFGELEKSKSHLLIDRMRRHFAQMAARPLRTSRIIPEPFFVHSDLATGVVDRRSRRLRHLLRLSRAPNDQVRSGRVVAVCESSCPTALRDSPRAAWQS